MNIETGIEEYEEVAAREESAEPSPESEIESETCHCGRPVDGTTDLGPAPMRLCSECLLTRCDAYPLDCPYRMGKSELEQADEIPMAVLSLRAYGENEDETWDKVQRRIEEFLRMDRCRQCGMRFSHRACGPTHAMIWNEMQNRTGVEVQEVQDFEGDACPTCGYELYYSAEKQSYFCHGLFPHRHTQESLEAIAKNIGGAEKLTAAYEEQERSVSPESEIDSHNGESKIEEYRNVRAELELRDQGRRLQVPTQDGTPLSRKMFIETLCVAQSAIGNSPHHRMRGEEHNARLQVLIDIFEGK